MHFKEKQTFASFCARFILSLPRKVTFTDGSTIEYTYAADGTKLRTKHVINGTTTTTDYCGNVIYENGVQKLLLTEAGYLTLADSKYHYYLQDHQGNNRVVIDQNGTVEETNHYYPFGGVFANSTSVQPYKYNGKELDTKKGLNWYDYGARHYDAALGRFATVDPMAEKLYGWAPYAYCYDNPIKHVDKDGKIGETVWDVFSLIMGVESFTENVSQGNIGAAVLDGVGIIADAAAVALPLVPGGAGAAIKGARAVDKAVDAVSSANKVDKAIDVSKTSKYEKFGGKNDTQSITGREAFRKAKDQNAIPRSQQPENIKIVREKGTGKPLKVYEYKNSEGKNISIRKDNPKIYPDGGIQGKHYNAGDAQEKLKQHHYYEK